MSRTSYYFLLSWILSEFYKALPLRIRPLVKLLWPLTGEAHRNEECIFWHFVWYLDFTLYILFFLFPHWIAIF